MVLMLVGFCIRCGRPIKVKIVSRSRVSGKPQKGVERLDETNMVSGKLPQIESDSGVRINKVVQGQEDDDLNRYRFGNRNDIQID